MAEHDQVANEVEDVGPAEYEPVTYCRDERQAEQFRDLLIDHDIPAILPDPDDEHVSADEGIAVLVPINSADEARDVLEEIELIEELHTADPDFDGLAGDDEEAGADMQPLSQDAYSLDGEEDPPDVLDSDDEL